MSGNVEQFLNKTQGQEHMLPCIKCAGKTIHKVMASLDIRGDDDDDGPGSFSWIVEHQIVQCLGCKSISFRRASSNSEDDEQISYGEWRPQVLQDLYPSRIEGRKGMDDEIYYLPSNVMRIYKETLLALANQAPVLAGIGLRALIEAICKEKNATGSDLLKRIDSLVTLNILTPINATILHKIRTLGNVAAHEMKPHSEKQLGLAMDIIEHLLKDVYILPKQADSEFEE
jgi:hypothetical protein